MKNKGFTLTELLGVITLLAIISIIAFPIIINQIDDGKKNVYDVTSKMVYTAADQYIEDNINNYPKLNGNVFCIPIETLISEDYITKKSVDKQNSKKLNSSMVVQINFTAEKEPTYTIVNTDECVVNNIE